MDSYSDKSALIRVNPRKSAFIRVYPRPKMLLSTLSLTPRLMMLPRALSPNAAVG